MTRYPETTLPQVDLPPQVRWRTDRLLELADVIENKSTGLLFNMVSWGGKARGGTPTAFARYIGAFDAEDSGACGTVCCIGGHAEYLYLGRAIDRDESGAASALGLTDDEADVLFYPWAYSGRRDYTRSQAAAVLRHAAKEFVIDWGVAL